MKKLVVAAAILLFVFSVSQSQAQNQPNVGCLDKAITLQAEDVKQGFMKQGMVIYRDAMIGMESQTPFPIEVKLIQGHLYEFLFIGNKDASTKLELFDGEDQNAGTKTLGKGEAPGYIIYSFTPAKTDMYLLMLTQKLKNASMCGSFTIMEKGDGSATVMPQQQPAKPAVNNTDGNQKSNSNRYLGH